MSTIQEYRDTIYIIQEYMDTIYIQYRNTIYSPKMHVNLKLHDTRRVELI